MQADRLQVTQTGVEPVAFPLGEVVSVTAKRPKLTKVERNPCGKALTDGD